VVAGVSGEIDVGLAYELAAVLVWSRRLPPPADWLEGLRSMRDRKQLEAIF
jgi:hypothetical protein